jgi:hypothetical protein
MIEISLLADHPEAVPILAGWFRAQWPEYYAGRTPEDIAGDFYEEAQPSGLPVRLVAFAEGELAGTITLRERAIWTLPEYHPGLGAYSSRSGSAAGASGPPWSGPGWTWPANRASKGVRHNGERTRHPGAPGMEADPGGLA